ncbi:MAG: 4-hydroxybenzoyl-CoA reductase subunit beta [Burkholderiales bacterium]|nr:4-hydroxybenzoyl-CoA reductase subunit beta [Burkholderiales bacterium]
MERALDFEVRRPQSLAEAAALLATLPGARALAGGTDLVPNLRRGIERPPVLVDLCAVQDFDAIAVDVDGAMVLGAGVTLARIAADARIGAAYPVLAQAARAVAGPGHRNAATLGGNLCVDTRCVFYNQSEWWRSANGYCLKRGGEVCHVAPQGKRCHAAFCGDVAPALLALDPSIEIVAGHGARRTALAELYRDDGALHLTLARGEVVARVLVPNASGALASGYRKARVRGAMDFPLAGVAMALAVADGGLARLRVALTGTNVRPLLLEGTDALLGRPVDDETLTLLGKLVGKQVSPMRTTVTQANYRRQVATALARRLLRELFDAYPGAALRPRSTEPAATLAAEPASPTLATAKNAAAVLLGTGDSGRTALICANQRLSYAQLRDQVARAASALRRHGIGRGDRVAVRLPDGIAWVSAMLGAMWAGGVAVGVNPRIADDEWRSILGDADFRCIIAQAHVDTPAAYRDREILEDAWLREVAAAAPMLPEAMDAAAPALWTHSSGTSGRSKAVIHPHRFADRIEVVGAETLGITAADTLYASSKLFFAYPQANALYTGLKLGATVVLDAGWPTASSVAATIAAQRPTVLFSVPSLYRNLLKEGHARGLAGNGLRVSVSAGEALSDSLRDEWRRQTGLTLVDGFGASETLILVLVDRGDGAGAVPPPGVSIEALRSGDDAAPTRIRIRAPSLAIGYWQRPGDDAVSFVDGAFCPADLFERQGDGAWRFAGREDSLVKIHGRWIDLLDLEERLASAAAGIVEAAAVSVQDADGVDAVAFFYVTATSAGATAAPADIAAALAAFAQTLAPFQRPRFLHAVAALPRTATGKLIRRQLRELHRSFT